MALPIIEDEEKEIAESNARAEADIAAGRVISSEDFFVQAHKKLENLRSELCTRNTK
ncbi:MAG: hypothetical protein FWC80_04740 [Firmicutes bacterium]|nr:hypothetical protein [Bacillota bacterium]